MQVTPADGKLKRVYCDHAMSMAQAGNPYENAMMESFFKTLKHEEVNLCEYETFVHNGEPSVIRTPDTLIKRYKRYVPEGEKK